MVDRGHKATKITITYANGHTEEFDTFLAVVASGLTPVGMEDGLPIYMAEEGKMQARGIAHVAADAEVIGALVNTFIETIKQLFSSAGPEEARNLMEAILSVKARRVETHTEYRIKDMKSGEN